MYIFDLVAHCLKHLDVAALQLLPLYFMIQDLR
jgi:hypothetical protein